MEYLNWLWPKKSPRLPHETEPALLIKIDEQFEKSKRILLWYATLSILIGSAALMNQNGNCFTFAMVGNFTLSPAFISTLLLFYGGYLWWMYEYQLKRVSARNTPQFHKSTEDDFHTEIRTITSEVKSIRALLENFSKLDYNGTQKAAKQINDFLDKFRADQPSNRISELQKDIDEQFLTFESKMGGPLPKDHNMVVQSITKMAQWTKAQVTEFVQEPMQQVARLASDINAPQQAIIDNDRFFKGSRTSLDEIADRISKLTKSVGSLSGDIRKADTQKFEFADKFVPRLMIISALLLLGFTSTQPLYAPDIPFRTCEIPAKAD